MAPALSASPGTTPFKVMKWFIIALLILVLACCPDTITPRAQAQVAPALLVISCAVVAGAIVIYAYYRTTPNPYKPVILILEKSHFDGNWVAVATNKVVLGTNQWQFWFSDKMTDDTACYRVKQLPYPK